MFKVKFGAKTDIGKVRRKNEDGYLAERLSQKLGFLFAVADGMGGHLGGEVASSLALNELKEAIQKILQDLKPSLKSTLRKINQTIFLKGSKNPNLRGMGTTLTALILRPQESYLAQIGDSRCYLFRRGEFKRLTEDHSLVRQMVKEGKLLEEEAETHPLRSVLTRALGSEPQVEADLVTFFFKPQDKILLCTDGLSAMLKDEEIKTVLEKAPSPQEACENLVKAANLKGGLDNITVVLVEIENSGSNKGQN